MGDLTAHLYVDKKNPVKGPKLDVREGKINPSDLRDVESTPGGEAGKSGGCGQEGRCQGGAPGSSNGLCLLSET